MGKRTNIGSRLHSVERGNVVAGANEILDDAKGKKQNVINNDVDAELVRLDQSKQNNLTFDNTPTEGSDNPVKSGGVYAADKALSDAIEAILILIPSAATALNQLADKSFVNSSIATDTATFRGTSAIGLSEAQFLEWANSLTHDMNDYVFWQTIDEAGNTLFKRYKWNGTQWLYEYTLNNSSFTADQWAAITSGITTALVEKLVGLPTNAALQQALNGKQNALTFDNVPTEDSTNPVKSGGIYSVVKAEEDARLNLAQTVNEIGGDVSQIEDVIPAGATAQNKLVANASMEAYVASIINNITASFTLATADGHINLTLTQVNGQVATLTLTSSDIASAQALTSLTGRVSTAEGNITSLTGRVSTNETDIANLQQLYNDLQQSKPVPVTALPETGQQQGVIYRLAGTTSYSDYMWNGSTWVLMATYNNAIDPRPKKASQNLVTSGGVFDNMGALDVSELNATENPHTLAQYVDLSAALAAIPTDYQKGGMSIKFVQSSDNMYVQFRLMSDTFNTTPANWQGVDDVPTSGSDNLVKSGGVAATIGITVNSVAWDEAYSTHGDSITPVLKAGERYYLHLNEPAEGSIYIDGYQGPGYLHQAIGLISQGEHGIEINPVQYNIGYLNFNLYGLAKQLSYTIQLNDGVRQELEKKIDDIADKVDTNSEAIEGLKNVDIEENKRITTISAEQDYAIKTVQTQAGTDALIEIPVSIPKGEIFLAKVNYGDNLSTNTVAISLNEDASTTVGRSANNEWVLIKPSVDVILVRAFIYRTLVVGTGDFFLTIKKLQSITADGKLPLYDGGLTTNGGTFTNADRKTTRVILNDAPLYLYLSEGYQVAYMYGNEPDNLTDGSYITALNGGGETILNVGTKYIGFTIVKPSAATFDNLRFVVANADSNDAKISQTVNYSISNTDLYPFIQGARINGIITPASNRITSKIIDFSGTIVIDKDVNDTKFQVFYKAEGGSWSEVSTWVTHFEYTGDGQLYMIVSYNDNRDITPADAAGLGFNYFIKNTPDEVKDYPQYNFSVIGQGGNTYYDEPDIILRKNRRYKITFDGILATDAQSGEILNIGAHNVDNPEEALSIAYRTASDTSVPSTKYIETPYNCFIRHYSNLTKNSYLDIVVSEESTSVEKAVNQVTPDADKVNLLINNLKCRQFLEGDLVTEVNDILVYGAGISIVQGGNFYLGIMWAENAAGEYGSPEYNTGLVVGNVLDPYGTKQRYVAAHYGGVIVDGIAYDQITGETIAKKINDNEVAVFNCGYYLNGNIVAATKIFNLTTKTFGAFQKCYLNVLANGTNHRYQIATSETNVKEIHQLTGMHNWDDVPEIRGAKYTFFTNGNPIKIGEYFYLMMNIGEYAPALIRTQDFIDFYFVCELPFGKTIDGTFVYNPTEEVALAYMNNRLYASCRGNKGRFTGVTEGVDYYGYNQIMSANFDDVLAGTAQWDIVNLEPYWYEKPSMVAWNNQIYLLTGARGTWSYKGIEGKNLNRFKHMFFVFDRNLNILKKELMNPDDGWLHPTFEKFGNSVYSVNHTDVRNYMYDGTGNNRSELRLKRLDMQLLSM